MPKANNLKKPSKNELHAIAELFSLARSGLFHWNSDDNLLMNMGSISPEDINEEGSEGRDELLDILAEADFPKVNIDNLDIEPDDLQIIFPAVTSVLAVFELPGLKKGVLKKFNEAVAAAFCSVALNTASAEVNQKVGDIPKALKIQ